MINYQHRSRLVIDSNKSCICNPYIKEYSWRTQIIYLVGSAGSICNWTPLYYNKEGESVEMGSNYSLDDFLDEANLKKLVWSCQE